jgi:hypothetical protein
LNQIRINGIFGPAAGSPDNRNQGVDNLAIIYIPFFGREIILGTIAGSAIKQQIVSAFIDRDLRVQSGVFRVTGRFAQFQFQADFTVFGQRGLLRR